MKWRKTISLIAHNVCVFLHAQRIFILLFVVSSFFLGFAWEHIHFTFIFTPVELKIITKSSICEVMMKKENLSDFKKKFLFTLSFKWKHFPFIFLCSFQAMNNTLEFVNESVWQTQRVKAFLNEFKAANYIFFLGCLWNLCSVVEMSKNFFFHDDDDDDVHQAGFLRLQFLLSFFIISLSRFISFFPIFFHFTRQGFYGCIQEYFPNYHSHAWESWKISKTSENFKFSDTMLKFVVIWNFLIIHDLTFVKWNLINFKISRSFIFITWVSKLRG